MRKKLALFLVVTGCAASMAACDNGERKLPAEMVSSKHAMLNGTKDTTTAHKAVVGLYQKGANASCGGDQLFCTGTLIHPQWVLTAAHCVAEMAETYPYAVSASPCNKYIQIGVGNTESAIAKNLYKTAGASQIYYHKDYSDYQSGNYSTTKADIALIKLASPIPSSVAKPILPHPSWLKIGDKDLAMDMEFSGFGFDENGDFGTKIKFTGSVTDYCGSGNASDSKTGCKLGYVTVTGCHPAPDYCDYYGYQYGAREYVLMPYGSIYYDQKKGGPCQGDSGGPAFYKAGGVEYVSGVTSYGDITCTAYGISTAVQDYYDWILSIAPEVGEQYTEICDNGIDDDGNGLVDDKDPACAPVEPVCGDGVINTDDEECEGSVFRNGARKCSAYDDSYISGNVYCTAECKVAFDACVKGPVCGDGKVDAGEQCDTDKFLNAKTTCAEWDAKYDSGLVRCTDACTIDYSDCAEPVIADDPVEVTPEICNNNIDDDGNGLIDCNDPACAETCQADVCGNGIVDGDEECDGTQFLLDENRCSEWITSYVGGLVTCNSDCTVNFDACELPAPSQAAGVEICGNNIDDDKNGKVDCEDAACAMHPTCQNDAPVEDCHNGMDDDGDGAADCDDVDCKADAACKQSGLSVCSNKVDDNGDGLIDCEDPICSDVPECAGMTRNAGDDNGSKCQATPLLPSSGSFAAMLLGLLGLGGLMRRRREN